MDRFNLEIKISDNYDFVDRLNDICLGVLEYDMSKDEIANAINGLAAMLKLHTDITLDVYRKVFKLEN